MNLKAYADVKFSTFLEKMRGGWGCGSRKVFILISTYEQAYMIRLYAKVWYRWKNNYLNIAWWSASACYKLMRSHNHNTGAPSMMLERPCSCLHTQFPSHLLLLVQKIIFWAIVQISSQAYSLYSFKIRRNVTSGRLRISACEVPWIARVVYGIAAKSAFYGYLQTCSEVRNLTVGCLAQQHILILAYTTINMHNNCVMHS